MVDRGRILEIRLGHEIIFNGECYGILRIEIDHINFGLCPNSKNLNLKRRSHFSPSDVVLFVMQINGIDLMPKKVTQGFNFFALEMPCPIEGAELGRKYRLVFTTTENEIGTIGIITIYRVK